MSKQLDEMAQWELEARLGQLINLALMDRSTAEVAELKACNARQREAEALAEVSEIRQRLGLPDKAIGHSRDQGGDGQAPLSETDADSSGFEPFQLPQAGE